MMSHLLVYWSKMGFHQVWQQLEAIQGMYLPIVTTGACYANICVLEQDNSEVLEQFYE